jgi:hypothetical protein
VENAASHYLFCRGPFTGPSFGGNPRSATNDYHILRVWSLLCALCIQVLSTAILFSQLYVFLQGISNLKKIKEPCCCDERCESVESSINNFAASTCSQTSAAPNCGTSRNLPPKFAATASRHESLHGLQQIFRIFSNTNSQIFSVQTSERHKGPSCRRTIHCAPARRHPTIYQPPIAVARALWKKRDGGLCKILR